VQQVVVLSVQVDRPEVLFVVVLPQEMNREECCSFR